MTLDQVNERAVRAGLRVDETGAVWGNLSALHRYSLQLLADARAAAAQPPVFTRRPGFGQVDEGDYDLGLDGRPNRYRP